MPYVRTRCPACDELVRRRKDGTMAKHTGYNRKGRWGWTCVGTWRNAADLMAQLPTGWRARRQPRPPAKRPLPGHNEGRDDH